MVQFRVELTQEERSSRGKLIPCKNQATRQLDVCCRKPENLPVIRNDQIDKLKRQDLQQTPCPLITILPPISQCQGRPSNCWSVGVADTDCVGNALCCFDGCANVCQGKGPINGNPGPQTNARDQPIIAQPTIDQEQEANIEYVQETVEHKTSQYYPTTLLPNVQDQRSSPVYPTSQGPEENEETTIPIFPQTTIPSLATLESEQKVITLEPQPKVVQPNQATTEQTETEILQMAVTECSEGWKCVSDLFCDATSTMVQFRVELTQEERMRRGKLIPCKNQATRQLDVCCRKPGNLPVIQNDQIEKLKRQDLQQTPCPLITILPPISQCQGRPSNCWSVGVADTDCIGNALCCFDGCANVCQGEGPINGNPGPQTNARGQQKQQTQSSANNDLNSNKFQQLIQPSLDQELVASSPSFQTADQTNPIGYEGKPLPTKIQPVVQTIQTQRPINPLQTQPLINTLQKKPIIKTVKSEHSDAKNKNVPEIGSAYGESQEYPISLLPNSQDQPIPTNTQRIIFPEDNEETSFPTYPQTSNPSGGNLSPANSKSEQEQFTLEPQPSPVQVIQPNPVPAQQSGQLAASQPFVTCPSAMKCVLRINCNFNGVMVEEEVFLNQQQELQRVPLIPCFNPARNNAVDVCCRDPNYKDPWPNTENDDNAFILDNSQLNPVTQRQEPINNDLQVNVPKKRKTNAYGK
eukprot:GFUD01004574.1.p1 GENE.GFUD01004574.1~~GFUD01004574.1.p1  ORF type:complete len:722 (-),score=194.10 GFUD01004574.1:66-2147(-)